MKLMSLVLALSLGFLVGCKGSGGSDSSKSVAAKGEAGLTETFVASFSNTDQQVAFALSESQIQNAYASAAMAGDQPVWVRIYSCAAPDQQCVLYYEVQFQLTSYYPSVAVSIQDEGQTNGIGQGLAVAGPHSFVGPSVPGVAYVQFATRTKSGQKWRQLPVGLPLAPAPTNVVSSGTSTSVAVAVNPPLTAPVLAPGLRIDPKAAAICAGYSSATYEMNCEQNLSGKAFDPLGLMVCAGYSSASYREDCANAVAGLAFDPKIVKICQNYNAATYQQECILGFANQSADEQAILSCSKFSSASYQESCLKALLKAKN